MRRATAQRRRTGGFTLTELLVVIGALLVLSVLTVFGVRKLAKDARLASAKNTISAALSEARARAMSDNQVVLVSFRPRRVAANKQELEIVLTQWSGDSEIRTDVFAWGPVIDRYVPIADAPVRSLPAGIGLAGPFYAVNADETWLVPTYLPRPNEAAGESVGIMYDANGTTVTRNSRTDSHYTFIDYDRSGSLEFIDDFFYLQNVDDDGDGYSDDEANIAVVPFIAVFDEADAREFHDTTLWSNDVVREAELSEYITANADRINFNRYSGVIVK